MTKKELEDQRAKHLKENHTYKMMHWSRFNYKLLQDILYSNKPGKGHGVSYSDAVIMADTETSKKYTDKEYHNHVCAWTISIRAFNQNIVTLYGRKPTSFVQCVKRIRKNLSGDYVVCFFHNLPYDWVFLELFLIEKFGMPKKQLNIKSHYPLFITFGNGLQFRDSLILAQRSLEKWAKDMDVEHKKASGCWDYDKIRDQGEDFSPDELLYIEHDTLAGVECIQKTMDALGKKVYSLPYTATGIVREEVRRAGKKNGARSLFERIAPSYEQYLKLEKLFHGGFTHGNRHLIDELIEGTVSCYDFASSYPNVMLGRTYPMEKFTPVNDCKLADILDNDTHAFMFKLILYKPHLKDDFIPMPVLQASKCIKLINPVLDNGRVICCDYAEIYINEIDARVIHEQYDYEGNLCVEVERSYKKYLPRWLTDYVYSLFEQKSQLKHGDPVLYALAKARLNSVYGLHVQHSIKETIEEDYLSGEFTISEDEDPESAYEKYLGNKNNILPYFWGCWVTSYAMANLFELGKCIKREPHELISHWIYSDTDSIYSDAWDVDKVQQYNEKAKRLLLDNNYGPVVIGGKEFWLGIAEHKPLEDDYKEFKIQGAKRYCGRSYVDNELHITVAGVPKRGALCLHDDINNFTKGMLFKGEITGKKSHKYFYVEHIYRDKRGNLTGHSIDLTPCDYLLDAVSIENEQWMDEYLSEDLFMQVFDEGRL